MEIWWCSYFGLDNELIGARKWTDDINSGFMLHNITVMPRMRIVLFMSFKCTSQNK